MLILARWMKKLPLPVNIKDFPGHGQLAREVAEEAIVLLKNNKHVLPLDKKTVRSIAVIGPNAAEARIQGGGSSAVKPYYKVSPLEALRKTCGNKIKIAYELGCPNNIFTLPLAPACLANKKGGKPGLVGEYFSNNEFAGKPAAAQVDTSFDFMWMGRTAPVPKIKNDDFSIRWQGIFKAPETGTYKFGLATNGWGRIYIGDELVCSNWGERTMSEVFQVPETVGKIALEAGKSYPLKNRVLQEQL